MNKKLIALAVAGALGAPGMALAQASTVQIGGAFNLLYYSHEPNNPSTAKRGDILEQSEPEVRITGEEAIGGGTSVWFQCASTFDIGATGTQNGFCGRNSALGFKGNFGNIFQGNWDMPQKLVINQVRGFFSGTNALWGGSMNLLNGGSSSGVGNAMQVIAASPVAGAISGAATTMSNNASQFYRRQAQSWSYWSPVWSGLQLQGAFSSTPETTALPVANPLKPRLYSGAVHYTNGPLWLGVGYERHQDYNPGNTTIGAGASQYGGGTDSNWILGARYTFGGNVKVSALYSRSNYDVTNNSDATVDGWAAYLDWNIRGPHWIRAQYAQVQDISGSTAISMSTSFSAPGANTGATLWGVNYGYKFSKRSEGILSYQRLSNDANARFSMGKETPTYGASQTVFGLGFKHSF